VKIYVAVVEALRGKKKDGVNHQNWWFPEFHPLLNADVLFCRFFGISPCVWPNAGYWYCLFVTLQISLLPYRDSNESHVREVSVDCFNSTLKSLQNILIWTVWLEKASYMYGVCTGQTQDHSSHNASLWHFEHRTQSFRRKESQCYLCS